MKKKIPSIMVLLTVVLMIFSPVLVNATSGTIDDDVRGTVYENGVPKEGLKVEVRRESTMTLEGYGVEPDNSQGDLGTDYTDSAGFFRIAWLYAMGEWYIVTVYTPCRLIITERVQVWTNIPCLNIYYTCEAGLSPGYWKKAFNAFADLIVPGERAKGSIKEAWDDLEMWTEDIDFESRSDPTPWDLPPLAVIDYDSDGTFEMEDAYNIFNDHGKPWNELWIDVANWYNWAAGYAPYNG